jgi:hypothetical protein
MATSNSTLHVEVSRSSTNTSPKPQVKRKLAEMDSAKVCQSTDMHCPHVTTRPPASAVEEKTDIGLDTLCTSISSTEPTADNKVDFGLDLLCKSLIRPPPPVAKIDFGLDSLCASISPAAPTTDNKVDLGLDLLCESFTRSSPPMDKIDLGLDSLCASISPAAPTTDNKVDLGLDLLCESFTRSSPPMDKIDLGLDTLCASISPAAPTTDNKVDLGLDLLCKFHIRSPAPIDKVNLGLNTLCASLLPSSSAPPANDEPIHSPFPAPHADHKVDFGLVEFCNSLSLPAPPNGDTSSFGDSGKKRSKSTICYFLNVSTHTAYLAWEFGCSPPMSELDDREVQAML